jgi:glycosyltransferase involved in cell wall biosynthesis
MSNISIILNVYKRPETLELQINSILNQTYKIKPEDIHVWYNKSDIEQQLPNNKNIKTYRSSWNTKFFGRFTIPLLLDTEYIMMLDDDMLPGNQWIENCIDSMEKVEGIYGGSGVILDNYGYFPNHKVGWNGLHSNRIERTDLIGHCFFFKRKWIKYFWSDKPYSMNNGEDIHLSYMCQKYGEINTFVPPHPENNQSLWSTDPNFGNKVGMDNNASSLIIGNHIGMRDEICKNYIDNGWKIVNKIK